MLVFTYLINTHHFANPYVIIYVSSISLQKHFWKITEAVEVVSGNPQSFIFDVTFNCVVCFFTFLCISMDDIVYSMKLFCVCEHLSFWKMLLLLILLCFA